MAVANLTLLVIAMVGLLLDDRLITGAPAWLKPAKFGASTAIYLFTLAWMVRSLPPTRWLRIATPTIAWLIMPERGRC